MSPSEAEREALQSAGGSPNQSARQRACAIVLSKSDPKAREEAARLLTASYLEETQPSFHLIPRGDAMASESSFRLAYEALAKATDDFDAVSVETLSTALVSQPLALAPLRMIAGLTYNELSVAIELAGSGRVSGSVLRSYERGAAGKRIAKPTADAAAQAVIAAVSKDVLFVPDALMEFFHSKTDKRDTADGWGGVARDATDGVPYWALLYQRYVGGIWRQVQDAYSEVKGDQLLELPIEKILKEAGVSYHRAAPGATGAREVATRYGLDPGPDFLIPADSPGVMIESKVGEDGGTVRDKAARIKALASEANRRGLVLCAVIDGKGWSERPTALAEVVLATSGRTYTLSTLPYILEIPEVAVHRTS